MKLLLGLSIGIAFGAVLQLGGASSYRKILDMLLFRDFTLIKMILAAIGVGAIGIHLLDAGGLAHLSIKGTYVVGLIIAGLIFGVGFALAGYCPGTALVAAAEAKRDAWFTVAGGLVGAGLYALAYPVLAPLLRVLNFGSLTLPGLLGIPGVLLALPFGLLLLLFVWLWIPDRGEPQQPV